MIQNKQLHSEIYNDFLEFIFPTLQTNPAAVNSFVFLFFNNEIFCFIVSGTKYLLNFSSSSHKWFIS